MKERYSVFSLTKEAFENKIYVYIKSIADILSLVQILGSCSDREVFRTLVDVDF